MPGSPQTLSGGRERAALWLLAALQFSHLLDFMILAPLGPQFMRLWGIGAHEVGHLVAVYAVAAAGAGLVAALVIDRFERRRSLAVVFAVFILATLSCALATGFWSLLAARALAGASGGIVGAMVLAIVGDIVPEERRGRAMGLVLSAFPVVSVLGLPLSLHLAVRYGYHAPFVALAALGALLLPCIALLIPRIDRHVRSDGVLARGWWRDFRALFAVATHRRALAAVFLFTLSGFAVFPFLSAYQVRNVGISEAQLAWVFLAGGLATMFTARLVGWSADRFGKRRVFLILAWSSIVPVLAMTHLPRVPLAVLLCVSTLFMVLMSGRFIPLMALVTMCVDARVRGAFMSLSGAVQNLAAGVASLGAGILLGATPDGAISGFGTVGVIAAALTLACILVARRLAPAGAGHAP